MKHGDKTIDILRPFPDNKALRPEIILHPTETNGVDDEQLIQFGHMPIILQKMFGPTVFCDLRIRPELESCDWVIERKNVATSEWSEVIRIPGQIESEFADE